MGKRKEIKKRVEQNLDLCRKELDRIEAINKKAKDPAVSRQVKEAKNNLKKTGNALKNWLVGAGALVAVTAASTAAAFGLAKLSDMLLRRNFRAGLVEFATGINLGEIDNRGRRLRPDEPANPDDPRADIINASNPRRMNAVRQRGQQEINATNERLRNEMAARQAQREAERASQAAQSASQAIGRAQEGIRQLDLDQRASGPVNSPGDQSGRFRSLEIDPPRPNNGDPGNHSGRFSGLDLDSGYKVRRMRNALVTHDSMPWCYPVRYHDADESKLKVLSAKLKKVLDKLRGYAYEHPVIATLCNLLASIIYILNKIFSALAFTGVGLLVFIKVGLKLCREGNEIIRSAGPALSNKTIGVLALVGLLNEVSACLTGIAVKATNPKKPKSLNREDIEER